MREKKKKLNETPIFKKHRPDTTGSQIKREGVDRR